jgi:hypothetical protein
VSARPTLVPSLRSGRTLGWLAIAILMAIALTADARAALAQSESLAPEATATPTPTQVPTGTTVPTPTPEPTETDARTATPAPAYPLLTATLVAFAKFECDRRGPDGVCFVDADDRGLIFTAEFEGARVISVDPEFPWWHVELPGTASGIGPGGSVRAVLTAAPEDQFRVVDVACLRGATPFEDEIPLPATQQGNGVVVDFQVAPTEEDVSIECHLALDPALYPRFSPPPSALPPTDSIGAPAATGSDGLAHRALVILAGLVAGALVLSSRRYGPRTIRQ